MHDDINRFERSEIDMPSVDSIHAGTSGVRPIACKDMQLAAANSLAENDIKVRSAGICMAYDAIWANGIFHFL